jgi:hypothetical protein
MNADKILVDRKCVIKFHIKRGITISNTKEFMEGLMAPTFL